MKTVRCFFCFHEERQSDLIVFFYCRERIERMADAKTERQKVKEITDKLEEGLKELFESEKYKNYLSTMSKVNGRKTVLHTTSSFFATIPLKNNHIGGFNEHG